MLDKGDILEAADNLVKQVADMDYQRGVVDMAAAALEFDDNAKYVLALYLGIRHIEY